VAIPVSRTPGAKAAATTAAVSVALPASIAAGDITILVAETDPTGTVTITVTGGQAWTAFTGSPVSVASGSKLYIWWRRHIGGNTAPSVQASVDHVCAGCTAYSGCVGSGDPVNVSATGTETASDTTFQFITGLTTTKADCLCVCICTSSADSNTGQFTVMTNGNLSSMAEKMDYETTSGHGGGFAFDEGGLAVAGAMGTFAATLSAAWPKAYIAFALKPPVSIFWAGAATATGGAVGVLKASRKIAGTAQANATATGALKRLLRFAGTATATSAATGALKAIRRVVGAAEVVAQATLAVVSGALIYWAGTSAAASGAELALKRVRGWAGAAIATSGANVALKSLRALAGQASATTMATGALRRVRRLAGTAEASTTSALALGAIRRLAGAAAATSTGEAVLRRVRRIAGTAEATASAALTLAEAAVHYVTFAGHAAAATTATLFLRAVRRIAGTATAQSGGSLALTTVGPPPVPGPIKPLYISDPIRVLLSPSFATLPPIARKFAAQEALRLLSDGRRNPRRRLTRLR